MRRPDARRTPDEGGAERRRAGPRGIRTVDATAPGLIISRSVVYADGDVAELVLRRSPEPSPERVVDYSLAYLADGVRVVGLDNAGGGGPRRHVAERAVPYRFEGVDRLLADFLDAVDAWRAANGRL